jgi:hypothetical protein
MSEFVRSSAMMLPLPFLPPPPPRISFSLAATSLADALWIGWTQS